MLVRTSVAAFVLLSAAAPLCAQSSDEPTKVRSEFLGGGLMRFGPSAFGGLEYAMTRWLALRVEGLVSLQQRDDWPDRWLTSFSLSSVYSMRADKRVSPYVFGGFAYSMSRHFAPDFGLLGGGGLRLRLGKLQPFIETRAQHRIGAPISVGLRF